MNNNISLVLWCRFQRKTARERETSYQKPKLSPSQTPSFCFHWVSSCYYHQSVYLIVFDFLETPFLSRVSRRGRREEKEKRSFWFLFGFLSLNEFFFFDDDNCGFEDNRRRFGDDLLARYTTIHVSIFLWFVPDFLFTFMDSDENEWFIFIFIIIIFKLLSWSVLLLF